MGESKAYKRMKKVLLIMLTLLILFLIAYVALFFMGDVEEDSFAAKISTFLRVFTVGVDTKITEEDNTILENPKKVEVEESVGSIDVQSGSKEPKLEAEKKDVENYAAPESTSSSSLYYNQLDEYGKIIYTKLKNESAYFLEGQHTFNYGYGFNDLLNTPDGDVILKQSFQYSINALLFDYPELFFVDIEKISLAIERTEYNNSTAVNKVSISNTAGENFYIKGLNNKEDVNKRRDLVYKERDKVLEAIKGKNIYEKTKYIQNYIIDKTSYDQKLVQPNIYDMSGPILNGYAVCEGYAKAFKFLMDGAKIPTIVIAGKAYDGDGAVERHAWNYVSINNKWYLVDTTWNDPIIQGGYGLTDELRYKYFLVGRNETRKSHVEDGNIVSKANFKYPELSTYSYSR